MAEKISDGFKYVYILKNKKTFFLRRPLCYLFELGQPELYAWDGAIKYDSYAKIYENLIYCSSPKEPFKENLLDDNKYEALYKDLCKAIKNKNFLKEDYSSDYD